jgi:hypothetical protein
MGRKVCAINSSWLSLAGGRLDAEFWVLVGEALQEREIDMRTATLEQVRKAIERVDAASRETEARVRQLRAEAQERLQEARRLERTLPRYPVTPGGPSRPRKEG